MAKLSRFVAVAVLLTIGALDGLGRLQTVESAAEHRHEYFQTVLNVVTTPPWWLPFAILIALLAVWVCYENGIPPWPTDEKSKEESIYGGTVALIGDPSAGAYLPLSAFWKLAGYELSNNSIKRVFRRLAKVNMSPLDGMPINDWVPFVRRAREVGRNFLDSREVVLARDEWEGSRNLRPSWEKDEATGFPISTAPRPSKIERRDLTVFVRSAEYISHLRRIVVTLIFRNNDTTQRTVLGALFQHSDPSKPGTWHLLFAGHEPDWPPSFQVEANCERIQEYAYTVMGSLDALWQVGTIIELVVESSIRDGVNKERIPILSIETIGEGYDIGYQIYRPGVVSLG